MMVFVLMLITRIGFTQNLGFQMPDGVKRVRIPFQLHNNLIVIPVIINDILPLRFVLDTGVRTTILTDKVYSDILMLHYDRHMVISGVGGEKLIDAYITSGVSIQLPGIRGEGHAMLVLENDYIELSNYLGVQVNGILGYELFSRFIVGINFDKKIITLTKPEYFKPRKKYTAIPMTVEDTKPYITSTVTFHNGTTLDVKLMVDSGASHGLWLDELSDSRITAPNKHIISTVGRGLAGDVSGKIARVKSLQIHDFKFEEVLVTFPESNLLLDSLKAGGTFRNGTFGGEILSRFNVYFNFPEEKLYLKKNPSFGKGFEYNMSGIVIKATGPGLGEYEIVEVRKGSSAERADIKAGDKVLSINHVSVDGMPLQVVIGYFNSKPNRLIKVELVREGQKMHKRFRLERQI